MDKQKNIKYMFRRSVDNIIKNCISKAKLYSFGHMERNFVFNQILLLELSATQK